MMMNYKERTISSKPNNIKAALKQAKLNDVGTNNQIYLVGNTFSPDQTDVPTPIFTLFSLNIYWSDRRGWRVLNYKLLGYQDLDLTTKNLTKVIKQFTEVQCKYLQDFVD